MRRTAPFLTAVAAILVLAGADGCSSDPNVEGARTYIRQQEYGTALERLDAALATNPDNLDALVLKAQVLRLQSDAEADAAARRPYLDQLVATLSRIDALDAGNADAARERQAAYYKEMNAGVTALQSAGGNPAQLATSSAAFTNATVLYPDSADAYYNLGLAYLVGGSADQAIPSLEGAVQRGVSDVNAYVYLGRAYLAASRGADAVTLLERARTSYPDDASVQAELLNAYAATGQSERALGEYERAVQRDPGNALYRYNYGSTLLAAGRFVEAREQLAEAARLDPSNANAHFNLGAAFQNEAVGANQRAGAAAANDPARDVAIRERNGLLEQALPHLVEARRLITAEGESPREVCEALLRVYTTLDRPADAEEAGECADRSMN